MDCKICGKILSTPSTLKNHMLLHKKEGRLKCPESSCAATFAASGDANRHYRQVHSKLNRRPEKFPCVVPGCQHISKFKQRRQRHMKKSHADFPAFKCSLCPFQTKKNAYLTAHVKIIHLKERNFSCSHKNCNYSATTSSNLSKHLRSHLKEEDRRFPCPHSGCSKRFNQMATLRVHERVHTQEKNYCCSLCDYKGGNSGNLKVHMTTHTKEKNLRCKLCDYSTSIHGNLTQHIRRNHVREKLFQCQEPDCDSSFVSKAELISHGTTHSGEKNYKCKKCHMKFSFSSNLLRHLRTAHRPKGTKPRKKCAFSGCSYRCDSNAGLKSHIQSKHSKKRPFSCPVCRYRCKLKDNLAKHVKKVHNRDEKNEGKSQEIKRCTICGFVTRDDAKLALHFQRVHQLPEVYLSRLDEW